MRARLFNYWDLFRGSFWFLPVVMSTAAVFMGAACVIIDSRMGTVVRDWAPWVETTPSAARSALSSIASAMITLAGVIFSITVVTVSMASSQYGSRLLRCFMEDSLADFVMGAFVGTALFSLVTLKSVRDLEDAAHPFVPHLSTALAMLMGLGCVGLLIYFIHDVAVSVQAPKIVQALARDLDSAVDRLFPDDVEATAVIPATDDVHSSGEPAETSVDPADLPQKVIYVPASGEGYVEGIDLASVAEAASCVSGTARVAVAPGAFLARGDTMVRLECGEMPDQADSLIAQIQTAFVIGARRTPRQDVSCSIYELVDVAIRALSPGINDPMTAMNCVDRLGAAMGRLVRRQIPPAERRSEDGHLLVLAQVRTSADLIHDAFRQIRQYGASRADVAIRLIETLSAVASAATRDDDLRAIAAEAGAVRSLFLSSEPADIDAEDFRERFDALGKCLGRYADGVTG